MAGLLCPGAMAFKAHARARSMTGSPRARAHLCLAPVLAVRQRGAQGAWYREGASSARRRAMLDRHWRVGRIGGARPGRRDELRRHLYLRK